MSDAAACSCVKLKVPPKHRLSWHDAARRFGAAFPCEQSWSYFHVTNTPIQAHNMTAVASHPIAFS